jgi:hypothetical protein
VPCWFPFCWVPWQRWLSWRNEDDAKASRRNGRTPVRFATGRTGVGHSSLPGAGGGIFVLPHPCFESRRSP